MNLGFGKLIIVRRRNKSDVLFSVGDGSCFIWAEEMVRLCAENKEREDNQRRVAVVPSQSKAPNTKTLFGIQTYIKAEEPFWTDRSKNL